MLIDMPSDTYVSGGIIIEMQPFNELLTTAL